MYRVIVRGPDGQESSHPLGRNQGLIIGREATCDIVLASSGASRRHARLFTEGERLRLEDLGSQHGTLVAGKPLTEPKEIRLGVEILIGEHRLVVERDVVRPNAAAAQPAHAYLQGEGERASVRIDLATGDHFLVGREAGLAVTIENDSVSRRHAELRKEGNSSFTVTDLGSSNGTFLNGTNLAAKAPHPLKDGDRISFGETAWLLRIETPALAVKGRDLPIKLILGAVVLSGVAVTAVLNAHKPAEKKAAQEIVAAAREPASIDIDEVMAIALHNLEDERFDDARNGFSAVLKADPLHEDALEKRRLAERESENQKRYNEAEASFNMGREVEALEHYVTVDLESRFFTRARLKVQELAGPALRKLSSDCRSSGARRLPQEVVNACARYLDYQCHGKPDRWAIDELRAAERAAKVTKPWECPARIAPFFGGTSSEAQDSAAKAVAERYPDADVRAAMNSYLKGDFDTAVRALQKVKRTAPGASALHEQLPDLMMRYRDGDAASRSGRIKEMRAQFEASLAVESALLPPGVTSAKGREMRTRLAKSYLDAGQAAFDAVAYPEAFQLWSKGLEFAPNDPALGTAVSRLERRAVDQLAKSTDCETLDGVMKTTRASPPSVAHAKAKRLFDTSCKN